MTQQRWHTLEKIQVEIAAAAALAAMYFLFWPMVKPPDVDSTATFLPLGAYRQLLNFALLVWILAAGAAVLTTTARPQGALWATLVGAGSISLHSQPMQLLLMRFSPPSALLSPLIAEQVCMFAIMLGAALLIHLVRLAAARLRPQWVRQDELLAAAPESPQGPASAFLWLLTGQGRLSQVAMGPGRRAKSMRDVLLHSLAALGLTLLIGLLLMNILVFATARGQLLFGTALAFVLAAAAASYFFPLSFSTPCWIAPLLLGIFFYARSCWVGDLGPLTWMHLDRFTHILPVDWLSAGCGGAVGGYWLAARIHETKAAEQATKATPVQTRT
jgi:hypothetical protein